MRCSTRGADAVALDDPKREKAAIGNQRSAISQTPTTAARETKIVTGKKHSACGELGKNSIVSTRGAGPDSLFSGG